ncbi:MAG: DUF2306 domain-containing protein [Hyphomicrobiales bacterium]|nr:DUF2306 domain-containing protein [Hyphomicrobiales bacterium]MDE2017840.1 DUF2306 domain-containing protein [Hyphomicrobiales bacterium]
MDFSPILAATAPIKLHLAALAVAVPLAPVQILAPKGSPLHRALGRIWVAAMAIAAASALFILDRPLSPHVGPFSWLHLLAIFTLWSLWRAIRAARAGRIAEHRGFMLGLAFGALLVPGLFAALTHGRILNLALFGR